MEDRKRRSSPLGDGSDGREAQKRKLSLLSGPASAEEDSNGVQLDAALGLEDGFLESFRKGALHRQMLEYKRDWERISTKAEKVEKEWKDSNAKLAEIDACWARLVDELRNVLGEQQGDVEMLNGHTEDNDSSDSQLSSRVQETSRLIALLAKKSTIPVDADFLHRQDMLSKELIQSQSLVKQLQGVLEATRGELDSTLAALRTAQKQVDRRRSDSVRKLNKSEDDADTRDEKAKSLLKPASTAPSAAPSPAGGSPRHGSPVKHEVKEEQEQNELRDVLEGSSGLTRSEIEALQQEAETRQKEAEALRQEKLLLDQELNKVKTQYATLPDAVIEARPIFQRLQADLQEFKASAEAAQKIQDELKEELTMLRGRETQFRHDVEQEFSKENGRLNKDLSRLQNDLTRVRADRDSGVAELAEYRTREAEKCRHVEEMKTLAISRQMRISTLVSEIYRLRIALAAEKGDSELLQTYEAAWKGLQDELQANSNSHSTDAADNEDNKPEEVVVKSLQGRVKELEALTVTYREQLQTLSGAASDEDLDMAELLVKGEAQARADLEEAQAKIVKLEQLLTDSGTPDLAKVSQKASETEKAVAALEAKVKGNDLSTNMLITEISRLSETWEQLNKQNQSKIFDLAQYDVRLERMATEKAKANQKYFASEREKEALTNQSVLYQRLSSNQKAVIAQFEEEKRALSSKLVNAEKELAERYSAEDHLKAKIKELERAKDLHASTYATLERQFQETEKLLSERTTLHHTEETQRKKAEEQLSKLEKEVEKWKGKANQATAAANGQGRYVETDVKGLAEENTLLKRMLKCSSCRQKFKSHTITRCFHMFCKDCIDSRLETRQRKCPSCSAAFGAHDVQQVYF